MPISLKRGAKGMCSLCGGRAFYCSRDNSMKGGRLEGLRLLGEER